MRLPASGVLCTWLFAAQGACRRKRRAYSHRIPSRPLHCVSFRPPSFRGSKRAVQSQTIVAPPTCSAGGRGIVGVRWAREGASSATTAEWPVAAAASRTCLVPVARQPTLVWGTTVAHSARRINQRGATRIPGFFPSSAACVVLPPPSPRGAPPPVADLCRRRRTSAFGGFPPSSSCFLPESCAKRANGTRAGRIGDCRSASIHSAAV